MSKVDPTLNLTPTPAERKARPDIWGPRHTPAEEQARISWDVPAGLAEALTQKTKEIEASGICEGYSRVDPMRIAAEVRERRAEQDKQWGGPKHDDEHFPADWVRYIRKAARQAMTREVPQEAEGFEDYMLDVAALAVAAIESSRRKRATAGDAWGGTP
jgi:hypothetical protein